MMKASRFAAALTGIAILAGPAVAHEFGFAGVLSNTNKGEMPEITLSVGQPIAEGPITLKSGMLYELEIEADGSGELALEAPGFFRAIWVNEVVINGLEVRPFGLESVEFDEAGTMEIEFLAIKPGRYELKIPGSTGESQRVEITIQ
jgi:hypothetical protein